MEDCKGHRNCNKAFLYLKTNCTIKNRNYVIMSSKIDEPIRYGKAARKWRWAYQEELPF